MNYRTIILVIVDLMPKKGVHLSENTQYFEGCTEDIHSHGLERTNATSASSPFQVTLARWNLQRISFHAIH